MTMEKKIQKRVELYNTTHPYNGEINARQELGGCYTISLGAKQILSDLSAREAFCVLAGICNYAKEVNV